MPDEKVALSIRVPGRWEWVGYLHYFGMRPSLRRPYPRSLWVRFASKPPKIVLAYQARRALAEWRIRFYDYPVVEWRFWARVTSVWWSETGRSRIRLLLAGGISEIEKRKR